MGPTARQEADRFTLQGYGTAEWVQDLCACSRECSNQAVITFTDAYQGKVVHLCSEHLATAADACRVTERNMTNWVKLVELHC